ncbi:hypothetical protein AXX17_AT3G26030 [Arabidopsis thaliana]|uniref:Small EDRK-rich factor-like N-terminal domain-containing protein n=1 Tax=Arabidopsis thaliana TaxID=3702 RepID=A0A178VDM4_ARATH|nr:hypothetical protein AXX17_AT3G26030 [Arabidopsis thaliana]
MTHILLYSCTKTGAFGCSFHEFLKGGSQRERDRERALARTGGKGKNKDDGLNPEQRRERDAKALQEKTAKKAAQAAAAASSGGGGGKGNSK